MPGAATAEALPDDAARVAAALAHLAALHEAPGITGVPPSNVVELLGALGIDPKVWPDPLNTMWDRLVPTGRTDDAGYKTDLRIALAVSVAGRDARDVHGKDTIALARAGFDGAQFGLPTTINDDAFAILALRAAGVDASDAAIQRAALAIEAGRAADGGWSHTPAASRGDPDMTGMMLAALASAGRNVAGDTRARTFLDSTLDASGGHTHPFLGVNCQSTVWAIHAYALMGDAPRPRSLDHLRGLQDDASGGFRKTANAKNADAWCTTEAALLLSGARWPLPGYAGGALTLPSATVGRPASAKVTDTFDRATWHVDGTPLEGIKVTWTPTTRGPHVVRVHAQGAAGHAWLDGVWSVFAAPDARISGLPESTFRATSIMLDASGSQVDGGALRAFDVDWGDGNRTSGTTAASHQYARLGVYRIVANVTDAHGARSDDIIHMLRVENRAPTFAPTAARVTADRVTPVILAPTATDPDGDSVTLAWNTTSTRGNGAFESTFSVLGEHVVRFTATDAHGATRSVDITIVVENVGPRILNVTLPTAAVAGRAFDFAIDAVDLDGPAPRAIWRFGERTVEGQSGRLALDAGRHDVAVSVEDADGASRTLTTTLTVHAADAPPSDTTPGAPSIRDVTAHVVPEGIVLRFDSDQHASLRAGWASDVGNGSLRWTGEPLPLPRGWGVASGWLEATNANGTTRVEWGPVANARAPPILRLDAPARGTLDAPVRFDATALPNGTAYRYHFGDGSAGMWAASSVASHLFTRNGTFEVRVEAVTPDHMRAEATHIIDIQASVVPAPIDTQRVGNVSSPAEASHETAADRGITAAQPERRLETPFPWVWCFAVVACVPLLGTRRRSA